MAMTTTPTACEMCSLATTRSVWAPAMVLTEDHPTQAMLKEAKGRFFVSEVYSQSFRGHKVSPVEESNDLGSVPSPRISRAGHLSKTERRSEGSHVGGQDSSEGVGEENDEHRVTWKGARKQSQVQALDHKPSGKRFTHQVQAKRAGVQGIRYRTSRERSWQRARRRDLRRACYRSSGSQELALQE